MPPGFVNRLRANSIPLNTIPPQQTSVDYSQDLAHLATTIIYRSPLPSRDGLPLFILNSAAFPDANQEYYDELLPYVLARLPDDEELIGGLEYEIVFFAGGNPGGSFANKTVSPVDDEHDEDGNKPQKEKSPGFGWFMRAYNVQTRAARKRLRKLSIVHEKRWVRVIMEMFATVVSPKFRKKVVHASTLTALALHLPIEDLLIPPSAYFTDRKKLSDIYVPYASGKRAFGVQIPFPLSADDTPRLPRILRETSSFVLNQDIVETQGLFRVSARQQTVEVVREAFERGQKFIVWKDGPTTVTFPPFKEGFGDVVIEANLLDQMDGYDAHTAAALIKLWYKELKEPLFPQSSYQAIRRFYGDNEKTLDANELFQMLEPGVEYSPLAPSARMILKKHMLPLLSHVSSHAESNKMTPFNLAVCFAPVLLHGPDPMEDVKISTTIRKILETMIEKWHGELAPVLGLTKEDFENDLRMPANADDREDPIEEINGRNVSENQISGIALLNNDNSSSEAMDGESDNDLRPPLPPRPARTVTVPAPTALRTIDLVNNKVLRKPAPPLQVPPRYSTVVTDQAAALARLNDIQQPQWSSTKNVEHSLPTNTIEGALPTNTVEGPLEDESPAAHRNSIATIATLPVYEEMQLPLRQMSDPASLRSPESEQRSPSIPRKPVGEGQTSKRDEDGKG
ncbi:uncharacterized protein KY384_006838 [Bacidia gigantensis]|uniref:uncharacterized protein n=1 Tax=Bacidia gigantensis TaxID=2732470 RepID=UPI001D047902|nr:uncharacterized protein KY384_006838 [Bacidia gigantensis]KAG8527922.1 hypothetical protein KY384_006838 [Bacidia gigantensis]